MKVRIIAPYRGKLTGNLPLRTGVQELPGELASYLLENRPDVCRYAAEDEEEELEQEEGSFGSNEGVMSTKNARGIVVPKKEEVSKESPFVCCRKEFGNQGSLNLHRRSRSCPLSPKNQ